MQIPGTRQKLQGGCCLVLAKIRKNKENQILFIFRKGKWDLPKGKIEKNEKIDEGALREVIEETGIKKVKIDGFFDTTYHIIKTQKQYFLKKEDQLDGNLICFMVVEI